MAITIQQNDIEAVFGADYVAQWSTFIQGRNAVPTPARINQAIALGQSFVNNRLAQSQYAVPLTANDPLNPPPEIVDAMATYAGWWLWKTRGINYSKDTIKWMTEIYTRMVHQLISIKVGNYPVDAQINTMRRQVPMVVG